MKNFIKSLFSYRILGVPTTAVAMLVFSVTVAAGAWLVVATMTGNTLGAISAEDLEISDDNATWATELVGLFNNASIDLGSTESQTWYLRTDTPPAQVKFVVENVVYTEGPGRGATSGEKVYDYMALAEFTANAADLRAAVPDANGNLGGDFGDIIAQGSSGITIDYVDQLPYVLGLLLVPSAGDFDELAGDSFSFSIRIEAL